MLGGTEPHPAQQEAKTERGLIWKDLWTWILSSGVNPTEIHGRPTKFWEVYFKEKTVYWNEKDREYKMKRCCQTTSLLLVEIRPIKLFSFRTVLPSWQRKEPRGWSSVTWRVIPRSRKLIKKCHRLAQLYFRSAEPVTPQCLSISLIFY